MFTCVDMKTKRVFLDLQAVGKRFPNTNTLAREFVQAQSKVGDDLATRALRAVFRSRIDQRAKGK